jgi:hypothetical protein
VVVNLDGTTALTNFPPKSGSGGVTITSINGAPPTKCDINLEGTVNVADVQLIINEALGAAPPLNDLNGDGVVNVHDVQIEVNAALGSGCVAN